MSAWLTETLRGRPLLLQETVYRFCGVMDNALEYQYTFVAREGCNASQNLDGA
jgi:hypothetical protein